MQKILRDGTVFVLIESFFYVPSWDDSPEFAVPDNAKEVVSIVKQISLTAIHGDGIIFF